MSWFCLLIHVTALKPLFLVAARATIQKNRKRILKKIECVAYKEHIELLSILMFYLLQDACRFWKEGRKGLFISSGLQRSAAEFIGFDGNFWSPSNQSHFQNQLGAVVEQLVFLMGMSMILFVPVVIMFLCMSIVSAHPNEHEFASMKISIGCAWTDSSQQASKV